MRKRKERAFKSIEPASLKDQEISDNYFPPGIDMPKRPPWDFNMTKEQLEMREQRYFTVRNCDSKLKTKSWLVERLTNDSLYLGILGQHGGIS